MRARRRGPRAGLRILAFAFTAALLAVRGARAQEFAWAAGISGPVRGMAFDAGGNIVAVGSFTGSVDFDPGPGNFSMTSAGGSDAFILKLDAAGAFMWAKNIGGAGNEGATGVALDTGGAVYLTGTFSGNADFDPGPGTFTLTSAGSTDVFVAKLNATGNFLWADRAGGGTGDTATGIALAPSGGVVTVGQFNGTVDFDPGAGTANLLSPTNFNTYIWKLDAAGGSLVWAKSLSGSALNTPSGVAVDPAGNIHTVGRFINTVDFDPGAGTSNMTSMSGNFDGYVSKLDNSGSFIWARAIGGSAPDDAKAVAIDSAGNVLVTGFFQLTADFDPGAGVVNRTSAGNHDVFVDKLSSAGNLIWVQTMGGIADDDGLAIAVDPAGNVLTGGRFVGTSDFDPTPDTLALTSAGSDDAFISKLDSLGALVFGMRMGGAGVDNISAFLVAPTGDLYPAGEFRATGDFDPGPGVHILPNISNIWGFIVRLKTCGGFVDRDGYGVLLFPPSCTQSASGLGQNLYESTTRGLFRPSTADVFYLSSRGDRFAPLVVDDQIHIDGGDSGLGPYSTQPGAPPYRLAAPIEFNFVPLPARDVTSMIPTAPGIRTFELHDLQRAVYGHTAVYLVQDCGIWISSVPGTQIHYMTYADLIDAGPPTFEVRTGVLSELRADHNFTRSACLGRFTSTPAQDARANPAAGNGYYYLARGISSCTAQGFGNSTLVPDPRDALDASPTCP